MLFLKHENEGYLVNVFIFAQFGITVSKYGLRILDSNYFEGLAKILQWYTLNPEDVVRIEQGFKVLLGQIIIGHSFLILELINLLAMRIR